MKIYGSSDDIIIVTGKGISEEFGAYDFEGHLVFSDGTLLNANYDDDGIWRFDIRQEGTANPKKTFIGNSDDYSDIIEMDDTVKWVSVTENVVTIKS